MKSLQIESVKAKNILCFGDEGIDLKFSNYGNIILIKGVNYDNAGSSDEDRSNGSGKSSIPELISIALYGKKIKNSKKLKSVDVVNVLSDKGEIELIWDNCRVVRTFNKTSSGCTSKVQIWESNEADWSKENEETRGTSKESQAWIERKIGLNHYAFCSIIVFDDSDAYQFLEKDGTEKRSFTENLLGLESFRDYHAQAKIELKNIKLKLSALVVDYDNSNDNVSRSESSLNNLKLKQKEHFETIKNNVLNLEKLLLENQTKIKNVDESSLLAEWDLNTKKIDTAREEIEDFEKRKETIVKAIEEANSRLIEHRSGYKTLSEKYDISKRNLDSLSNKAAEILSFLGKIANLDEGTTCRYCFGVVDKKNASKVANSGEIELKDVQLSMSNEEPAFQELKDELDSKRLLVKKLEDTIPVAETNLSKLSAAITSRQQLIDKLQKLDKPDINAELRVLNDKCSTIKDALAEKKLLLDQNSPFDTLISESSSVLDGLLAKKKDFEKEIKLLEKEVPYYEYWVQAFSETGIRKQIIDKIIPSFNDRISYWLNFLIDGKIKVEFDSEFDESILRNDNFAKYHCCSKGEARRINLAVSQAFSYIMMLNSGSIPNLVFLDEVTGGSVDKSGVTGVFNMICELAKDRQVFVTTHDEPLLSLLHGCETLRLEKKNDITTVAQN